MYILVESLIHFKQILMATWKLLVIACCLLTGPPSSCLAACPGRTFVYNNTLTICYWLVISEQSAQLSEAKCIFDGGNLAYIPNSAANDIVNTLKADAGYEFTPEFYIGYRVYGTTVYVWETNQEQTYNKWYSGQPSTVGDECIVIYNMDGVWYDEDCSTNYKAVCSDYSPRTGPTTEPPSTTTTTTEPTTTTTTTEPTTTTTTTEPTTTTTTEPTTTTTTTEPTTTTTTEPTTTTTTTEPTTTTTTEPTTTTTTEPTTTTTQLSCIPCPCYTNTTSNKTVEEFREEVRKELLVDTSTLSSSIRKKTSASDSRPSAAAVGYVGVVLLTMVFGGLIMLDAGNFILCGKAVVNVTRKLLLKV